MFELGFSELIMIALVAIMVIGPKQLPGLMYKVGKWMRQLSYTRWAIEKQFEAFMDKEEDNERKRLTARPIIEHKPDQSSDGAA